MRKREYKFDMIVSAQANCTAVKKLSRKSSFPTTQIKISSFSVSLLEFRNPSVQHFRDHLLVDQSHWSWEKLSCSFNDCTGSRTIAPRSRDSDG